MQCEQWVESDAKWVESEKKSEQWVESDAIWTVSWKWKKDRKEKESNIWEERK